MAGLILFMLLSVYGLKMSEYEALLANGFSKN